MPQLRLALAQTNPTVGDLSGNLDGILRACEEANASDAQLVAFAEMALTGYPLEDLIFREGFARESRDAVTQLAQELASRGMGEMVVIVGYFDADAEFTSGPMTPRQKGPRDTAAVLYRGEIVATQHKHHLQNYEVFDENRYFVPGDSIVAVDIAGARVAIAICEDLWPPRNNVVAAARRAGAGLIVSINGSPYEENKRRERMDVCSHVNRTSGAAVAYVNLVGAQDELVFDGGSFVIDPHGAIVTQAPRFRESVSVVDLELDPQPIEVRQDEDARASDTSPLIHRITCDALQPTIPAPPPTFAPTFGAYAEEVWEALTLGLRDYARKNGFSSAVLGISGGIDSALTATLAADALGAENTHLVAMPSEYTSVESTEDAATVAKNLGTSLRTIPIEPMREAYASVMLLEGVAAENLQSRIRGTTVMAIANGEEHLPLATGNKSEFATGYTTLFGDMAGTYAPLKDVYKTLVYELAIWRNERARAEGGVPPIPERVLSKTPTAELAPGQKDTDTLPPYPELDKLLLEYVEGDGSVDGTADATARRVARMVDAAEYKRRQAPVGAKITRKAFGKDRRMPISNRHQVTEH